MAANPEVWIPIRGHSMWPSLRSGDLVALRQGAAPQVGEVVVVFRPSGLLAHRVVRREAERVVLRGDNCDFEDEPVALGAVAGVVSRVRRHRRELAFAEVDRGPTWKGLVRAAVLRLLGRARGSLR